MSLFRTLILLFTFMGVGMRVADWHTIAHELTHVVCEHGHHHDDKAPSPCHDPEHHHQCSCVQPMFCLSEIPEVSIAAANVISSPQPECCDWGLPEDPVYSLEIPPIIG